MKANQHITERKYSSKLSAKQQNQRPHQRLTDVSNKVQQLFEDIDNEVKERVSIELAKSNLLDEKRFSLSPRNRNTLLAKFQKIPAYSKKTSSYLTKFLQKEKNSRNNTVRTLTIDYPIHERGDTSTDYKQNNRRSQCSQQRAFPLSTRNPVNNAHSPSFQRKLTFGNSSLGKTDNFQKPGWAITTEKIFDKQFKELENMQRDLKVDQCSCNQIQYSPLSPKRTSNVYSREKGASEVGLNPLSQARKKVLKKQQLEIDVEIEK